MRNKPWGLFTFICLLMTTFIFAMFQGGFVSWFLFFSLLFLTVGTCLWYIAWFKGLTIERSVQAKQVVAGDTLQVTITIHNSWPWVPYAYLLIEDQLEAAWLKGGKYSVVIYPWFKRELVLEYELTDVPRGMLRFKQLTMRTGDLFGFIQKQKTMEQREQVLVYPKYQELTSWQNGVDRQPGRVPRQHQWLEDSFVAGVRDYTPGDRLTHIHWKASARSSSLKTKEFEQPSGTNLIFFLDREANAYLGDHAPLFERGVTLTASLIHYALKHAMVSGLVSHGKDGRAVLLLAQRHNALIKALEHLAQVEADSPLSFPEVILEQNSYVPRGATQVIVSPQLTKQLVLLLAELSHRQQKIEFFWLNRKQITSEEQQLLGLLQKALITYYLIDDEAFQETLSRGGGNRYASPTYRHI